MDSTAQLADTFNFFWEANLLPVYKSIETTYRRCDLVSSDSTLILDNAIEQSINEAVDLKRKYAFKEANQIYISIANDLLKQNGIVQSRVLYSWFKVLAPATLFREALNLLMFSRLISIRLTQRALVQGNTDAAAKLFDDQIFSQLNNYEYALTGDMPGLERYLRSIVGNASYNLPNLTRYLSSDETFSHDYDTVKKVYIETHSLPFAFYQAGLRMHCTGWSVFNNHAKCEFDTNGDYIVHGRFMPTGKLGFDEEGRANRVLNMFSQEGSHHFS